MPVALQPDRYRERRAAAFTIRPACGGSATTGARSLLGGPRQRQRLRARRRRLAPKHFTLAAELSGRFATIEFDGVYDHAEVWVNGHFVCGRPYGYSSFECPLTPHARFGAADNVISVRVDHSRFADSRWYTGSGIYRHVRLRVTDSLRIAHWGTFVSTPKVTADAASVRIETTIENGSDRASAIALESEISLDGQVVARQVKPAPLTLAVGERRMLVQDIMVARPRRWTPDSPALYTLRQRLLADAVVVDDADTTFGVRTIRFDAARGFFLNGEPVKLKGVCVHHDAGILGAAVPVGVWERRLRALKALGVNAIRTSHNPPAPEFLDLCDRLGLLVKDEAFDEFTPPKNKWVSGWNAGVPSRFGYGEVFKEWSVIDAADMVRRDRNHPSVIAWSIGNEVDYPNDPFSHPVLERNYRPENPPAGNLVTLARPLVDAIRALDSTRPVTMALASVVMSDAVGLSALLDIVGYNYQETRYVADHAREPARVIFGSESNHTYANWTIVRDNPWVAGQFLWTGIDYLGEAGVFSNRANGAGLLDLAGFKKPMAWFRQSLWSEVPMVYLAAAPVAAAPAAGAGAPRRAARVEEHWNWPAGSTIVVSSYTNADDVTLTLNDRPVGTKPAAEAVDGVLRWEVPFEPAAEGRRAPEGQAGCRVRARRRRGGPAVDSARRAFQMARTCYQHGSWISYGRVPAECGDHVHAGTGARAWHRQRRLNDATSGGVPRLQAAGGHQSTNTPGAITIRASSPGLEPATVTVTVSGGGF
jgi:beta-galactosidase